MPSLRSAMNLVWMACLLGPSVIANAQHFDAPVEARVPMAPTAFEGSDGKIHVAFEVHLTNFYATNGPLRLTQVQVFLQGSTAPLASYRGKELCTFVKPRCAEGAESVTLAAGERTVLFLWLSLPHSSTHALWHSMTFEDSKGKQRSLHGVEVALSSQPAIVIAPPLRGDHYWLVSEGPGNVYSHHWGSLLALNGVVTIPQRFAIDFVGLDAGGHALPVAPTSPLAAQSSEWYGYDSEILAVAAGIVRDARDGEPDGEPLAPHTESTDLTARGLYGNFVVLEIAPGVFAHYAHLRPGSVRVRAGQHVRCGEVIAHLGNSGNSAVPHLHFHVSNKPVFQESEGLPFRFANYAVEGKAGEDVVLSPASTWTPHGIAQHATSPLDSDVIAFR